MTSFRSQRMTHIPFERKVFYDKENLVYLVLAYVTAAVLWWIFKKYYPHPNIIFDSYYYLNATASNAAVNAWPIGYSWFVILVGKFSHSSNVLVIVQYFLLNTSLLIFFFSLKYIFTFPKWVSIILFIFLFLNPIFIYTSNLILSDTLFTALSILWITNIIWILNYPRYWMIITHAILILIVFIVRYNALYYPIVATISFLFIKREFLFKFVGIIFQFFFITTFICFTIHSNQCTFGVRQFSPFGGWKLANDALYMYKHIYNNVRDVVPQKFLTLDKHVRQYFNKENDAVDLFTPDPTSGSYYMYIYPSPLLTYRDSVFGKIGSPLDLNTFSTFGPLYQEYGSWLIIKNPISFSEYFIWPNIQRYFISPPEVYTDNYNPFSIRTDSLGLATINWFNLKSISAKYSAIDFRSTIFMNYPILNIIIHLMFALTYISLLLMNGFRYVSIQRRRIIFIIGLLWLFDFGFNVLAAAVVLRYQIFITVIEFSFAIMFFDEIINSKKVGSTASNEENLSL